MDEELIRGETVVRIDNNIATCRAEGSRIKCAFFHKNCYAGFDGPPCKDAPSSSFAPTNFMTTLLTSSCHNRLSFSTTSGLSMKLRLFALRDTSTNKLLPNVYFPDKVAAKRERDTRNQAGGSYVVTPGPDHRRYSA